MFEEVILLNGAIRFNSLLMLVNITLILHFCCSYYFDCYCKGFKVDYWHFNLFLGYVFPFLICYPFAGSDLNYFVIGDSINRVQEKIDLAYIITTTGYIFTYVGYYSLKFSKNNIFYGLITKINNLLARDIYFASSNRKALHYAAVFGMCLLVCFLGISFKKYGFNFNLRGETLANDSFKPIFNFIIASYIPLICSFLIIRYFQYKDKISLSIFIFFTICSIFSGSRSIIVGPFISSLVLLLISKKKNLSLLAYIVLAIVCLNFIFFISSVREGNYSISNSILSFSSGLFYGNNFSDIRDFAWILSYWDEEYIFGKSYLAGLISFIPRSLSTFRDTWTISIYTNSLIGADSSVFPGLRPGKFGEVFFNFGFIGVISLGFLGGYALSYADYNIKKISKIYKENLSAMNAQTFALIIVSQFYITASFWQFYVYIIMMLILIILRKLTFLLKSQSSVFNAIRS